MAHFVYHAIPQGFRGTTIYPLNRLRDVYPDLYEERRRSYAWRPWVMEQKVTPLDCLWNDCIFLMATPPDEVKEALQKIRPGTRFPSKFWKIPATQLSPESTAIYTFASGRKPIPLEDFAPYDPNHLEPFAVIPDRTIEYWRECVKQGREKMLLYLYIPHIMYRGVLPTYNLEIVEV